MDLERPDSRRLRDASSNSRAPALPYGVSNVHFVLLAGAGIFLAVAGMLPSCSALASKMGGKMHGFNGEELMHPMYGLAVGTKTGGSDVVQDGKVQPGWRSSGDAGISVVVPNEGTTNFFVTLVGSLEDVHFRSGPVEPDGVVHAKLVRTDGTVDGDSALTRIQVSYECLSAGEGTIFVSVDVPPPALSLTWHLLKKCTSHPRRGLNIGTTPGATDVVLDGLSLWTQETAVSRVLAFEASDVTLYFSLTKWDKAASATEDVDEIDHQHLAEFSDRVVVVSRAESQKGLQRAELMEWRRVGFAELRRVRLLQRRGYWDKGISTPRNTSFEDEKQMLFVSYGGSLSHGGLISSTAAQNLTVQIKCHSPGSAIVELQVSPTPLYQPYRPLLLSFVKRCGGGPRRGFAVGSHPFSSDLVRDGLSLRSADQVSNLFSEVPFYLSYRATGVHDDDRPKISVQCQNSSVAIVAANSVNDSGVDLIKARHTCLSRGLTSCSINFSFRLFDDVAVRWNKECGGPRRDVTVRSRGSWVYLQGKTSLDWDSVNPSVVLSPAEEMTEFSVSIAASMRNALNSQAEAEDLVLGKPSIRMTRPDVANATLIGELEGKALTNTSEAILVRVKLQCQKTGETHVEVTLPLTSTTQYTPLSFGFTKECLVVSFWQQWYVVMVLTIIGCLLLFLCCILCLVLRFKRIHDVRRFEDSGTDFEESSDSDYSNT